MDDLVSLAAMIGAIFFYFGKRGIVSDWSRVPNPQLVLKGVMGSLKGVKCCSIIL